MDEWDPEKEMLIRLQENFNHMDNRFDELHGEVRENRKLQREALIRQEDRLNNVESMAEQNSVKINASVGLLSAAVSAVLAKLTGFFPF